MLSDGTHAFGNVQTHMGNAWRRGIVDERATQRARAMFICTKWRIFTTFDVFVRGGRPDQIWKALDESSATAVSNTFDSVRAARSLYEIQSASFAGRNGRPAKKLRRQSVNIDHRPGLCSGSENVRAMPPAGRRKIHLLHSYFARGPARAAARVASPSVLSPSYSIDAFIH